MAQKYLDFYVTYHYHATDLFRLYSIHIHTPNANDTVQHLMPH